jgi:hypothetical protein
MASAKQYLYVTSVPSGEAPLWVREKWVGLKLPVTGPLSVGTFRGSGVLTGPRGPVSSFFAMLSGQLRQTEGYIVDAIAAVEVLASAHPDAAAWWKEHASDLIRPDRRFVFEKSVGHIGA